MMQRIMFGLDRLPRGVGWDDPRLPGVAVTPEKLRLNTEPLPPSVMSSSAGDHYARVAAVEAWLAAQCGDYAPQRRRFVQRYLACIAAHLQAHREELADVIGMFDGLYAIQDWMWSALRPLPRALVRMGEEVHFVDVAFWDGTRLYAIDLGTRETDQAALQAGGVTRCPVSSNVLAGDAALLDLLPDKFRWFWRDQVLPASPFRRQIPAGVLGVTA